MHSKTDVNCADFEWSLLIHVNRVYSTNNLLSMMFYYQFHLYVILFKNLSFFMLYYFHCVSGSMALSSSVLQPPRGTVADCCWLLEKLKAEANAGQDLHTHTHRHTHTHTHRLIHTSWSSTTCSLCQLFQLNYTAVQSIWIIDDQLCIPAALNF